MRLFALAAAVAAVAQAASPQWMSGPTVTRRGNKLVTKCQGHAPSRDLAYRSALEECRRLAADQSLDSFRVKSLTVQTERSAILHEEITSDRHVEGLSCEPQREERTIDAEEHVAYLECSFDLSRARVSSTPDSPAPNKMESEDRVIVVSSAPGCDEVLVEGPTPRSIACTSGFARVRVSPGDKHLVIRATGRLPARINLGETRGDHVEVPLEVP